MIGLTSTEEKADYLREIKIDHIINYRKENVDQVLKEKYPSGIDVIWDTVGGALFHTLFNNLAVNGRMVVLGSTADGMGNPTPSIENLNMKLMIKSQTISGFVLLNRVPLIPKYLKKIITAFADGSLRGQVDLGERSPGGAFKGLDQVWRAMEWLHDGKNLGKAAIKIQDV